MIARSRLGEVASAVKSANAGISWLTFDVRFDDVARYEQVILSEAITPDRVAALYGVAAESVQIYHYAPALTIKITIPRAMAFGSLGETDFDGVQQFVPLLNLDIPQLPGASQ